MGRNDGKVVPMAEVKMNSRAMALRILGMFVQIKRSESVDLGLVHIANSVTVATRVRADVLRAIADNKKREGNVNMFMSAYNSQPVLHVEDQMEEGILSLSLMQSKNMGDN